MMLTMCLLQLLLRLLRLSTDPSVQLSSCYCLFNMCNDQQSAIDVATAGGAGILTGLLRTPPTPEVAVAAVECIRQISEAGGAAAIQELYAAGSYDVVQDRWHAPQSLSMQASCTRTLHNMKLHEPADNNSNNNNNYNSNNNNNNNNNYNYNNNNNQVHPTRIPKRQSLSYYKMEVLSEST